MSQKELNRYDIVKKLINKTITGTVAADLLHRSLRQTRRLAKAVRARGATALVHGNRGKVSNRALSEEQRTTITTILKKEYPDFGPTFAAEKLASDHATVRSKETIRTLMIAANLWTPKQKKVGGVHRVWRQRRSHVGELIQFDGSYHRWFEDRGAIGEACLLAAIDDASGRIMDAQFGDHEGVLPVFRFWQGYCEQYGKPVALYLDKFSTYRLPERFREENEDLQTQFERAMQQLRIEPISAHSPQAKGRVERLFGTLQDRLVKELRLQKIDTVADANRFLRDTFIPEYNKRFAVPPRSKEDLHRPLTKNERTTLASIFSRQTERTIQNDFTISFQKQWFQIDATPRVAVRPKEKVTVEEHGDGKIHLRLRGKELLHHRLPERPRRTTTRPSWALTSTVAIRTPTNVRRSRAPWMPAPDHPWRQYAAVSAVKTTTKR